MSSTLKNAATSSEPSLGGDHTSQRVAGTVWRRETPDTTITVASDYRSGAAKRIGAAPICSRALMTAGRPALCRTSDATGAAVDVPAGTPPQASSRVRPAVPMGCPHPQRSDLEHIVKARSSQVQGVRPLGFRLGYCHHHAADGS